jgi:hypothetical protein
MYGRTKFGGDTSDLKINYKYIDESNKVIEILMPLDKCCGMLSRKFNGLVDMLKKDMEKNQELKKVVTQVNGMIVQLGKGVNEI